MFPSHSLLEAERNFWEESQYLCLVPILFFRHLLSVTVDSTILEELKFWVEYDERANPPYFCIKTKIQKKFL